MMTLSEKKLSEKAIEPNMKLETHQPKNRGHLLVPFLAVLTIVVAIACTITWFVARVGMQTQYTGWSDNLAKYDNITLEHFTAATSKFLDVIWNDVDNKTKHGISDFVISVVKLPTKHVYNPSFGNLRIGPSLDPVFDDFFADYVYKNKDLVGDMMHRYAHVNVKPHLFNERMEGEDLYYYGTGFEVTTK